jgi:hypothetical protein
MLLIKSGQQNVTITLQRILFVNGVILVAVTFYLLLCIFVNEFHNI